MPRPSRKIASGRRGAARRRSNRGAIRTKYGGKWYASKSEASYAKHLDLLLDAGKIKAWSGQERVTLAVDGVKVCVIVPDFLVQHNDGRTEYVEVKGYETPVYKIKAKLFKALYPLAWYTVVSAKRALAL